jgi:hypothetical protein
MKNKNSALLVASMLALIANQESKDINFNLSALPEFGAASVQQNNEIHLSHKEIVRRQKTLKQPKPGRNKPAKGYNSVTHEWEK